MSKSLGNSPDALQLLADFGADGVRYGLMSSAAAGGDILFDEKLCENGRNFCNKLWNALRLVKGWQVTDAAESDDVTRKNALAVRWLREKFQQVLVDVERDFEQFRLSEALHSLYGFIWDDFCSWYLEMIKPGFEQPIDQATHEATLLMYADLMVAIHPFMPFITEEIWHQLAERADGDDCCRQAYPKAALTADTALIQQVELAKGIITAIREVRNQNKLKPREPLTVLVQDSDSSRDLFAREGLREMVMKMAVLDSLELSDAEPANAKSFILGTEKYYVVLEEQIDVEAERKKMTEELAYQRGFVRSVEAKLANERFVSGAPAAVVEAERKKMADGLARIAILEESLGKM